MLISELENKKILLLGIGEEGIDSLLFLKKRVSFKKLGVADALTIDKISQNKKKHLTGEINLHLGEDYLSFLEEYDVIIKSPGIPLSIIENKKNQRITSQTDIFLSNCKGKVIGITGTKGKSTACTLLNSALQLAGKKPNLIGNIGKPALQFLGNEKESDLFVYELSSFQLQTVQSSPHIAVLLNIFTDHLDNHKNFEEYVSSKEKITSFQENKDFLIYNESDLHVTEIAKKSDAKKIPFQSSDFRKPLYKVMKVLNLREDFIDKALSDFKGLPHRMEYVGNYQGIDFYDDSAATIPEAVIKAVTTLKNIETLILGGKDKGADFSTLSDTLKNSDIKNIIIFKGTSEKVREKIKDCDKNVFTASDMEEAVNYCFRNTNKKMGCLLSPGLASFNMFKNYKERGEMFKKYVHRYKTN